MSETDLDEVVAASKRSTLGHGLPDPVLDLRRQVLEVSPERELLDASGVLVMIVPSEADRDRPLDAVPQALQALRQIVRGQVGLDRSHAAVARDGDVASTTHDPVAGLEREAVLEPILARNKLNRCLLGTVDSDLDVVVEEDAVVGLSVAVVRVFTHYGAISERCEDVVNEVSGVLVSRIEAAVVLVPIPLDYLIRD